MKKALLSFCTALSWLALLGCSRTPPAPAVKEYKVTGEVLKVDPAAQTVSLKAGKIEGWMEAMTMDFPIKEKREFENVKAGTTIHAKVSVQGTEYWLSDIAEVPSAAAPATPAPK